MDKLQLTHDEKQQILLDCSVFNFKKNYIKDVETVIEMVLEILNDKFNNNIAPDGWLYSFSHSSAIGHGEYDVGPLLTNKKDVAFGVGCFGQIPVYKKQKPSTVKMSGEQIKKLADSWFQSDLRPEIIFHRGVRAAEDFHCIRENKK